ncbi:hypothetical protein HMPREF0663_11913 [Hoylesella oralis ATCC 33269]|uniref:Mor transcription activator domain-containing protein n=2 Tax=Hoylesella oralis TaxID=28134 RepID=E7RRW2_9BACT|nr:hypothetical protein HMPREF0663_11913 [Hoylesella oralis ATCC 33269]
MIANIINTDKKCKENDKNIIGAAEKAPDLLKVTPITYQQNARSARSGTYAFSHCEFYFAISDWRYKIIKINRMKVIEILKFNRELLKRLRTAGIMLKDTEYINLYTDYRKMIAEGEKVSYVVAVLADRYSVSERKVYGLIKRFESDCKLFSVR